VITASITRLNSEAWSRFEKKKVHPYELVKCWRWIEKNSWLTRSILPWEK
jgi:hypothetical protein